MQSIIKLCIRGDEFLFEDSGFTAEQLAQLKTLSVRAFIDYPKMRELDEQELCSWFQNTAKEQYDITLKSIGVSFIVRINK